MGGRDDDDLELDLGGEPPASLDVDTGELDDPGEAMEIIKNEPPAPGAARGFGLVPLDEPGGLTFEPPSLVESVVRGVFDVDPGDPAEEMAIDRSLLPAEQALDLAGGLEPLALAGDEPLEIEPDVRSSPPAPPVRAQTERPAAIVRPLPPVSTPIVPARPAERSQAHLGSLEAALARLASSAALPAERRRAVVVRSIAELLAPIERPDVLADLLLHALIRLPVHVTIEDHAERVAIENGILEELPADGLVRACVVLASECDQHASESRLDLVARIVSVAAARRARTLDQGTMELLRVLYEHGGGLTRRLEPELREWAQAGRYLRATEEEAREAARALDSATEMYEYAAELASLERAVLLLATKRRWVGLAPLFDALVGHQSAVDAPFVERPQMAAAALERCLAAPMLAEIVQALSDEGNSDRAAHASIARVLAIAGPRVVSSVVDELQRTTQPRLRRTALELLGGQAGAARTVALEGLRRDLSPLARRSLIEVLAEVGAPEDVAMIARDRQHPSEEVRRAVLEALAALGGASQAAALGRGLEDPSRAVQARAMTLLGRIGSTDAAVLGRIAKLVADDAAPLDAETVVCAAIAALARMGEQRLPAPYGTVEELLVRALGRQRHGALRRTFGTKIGDLWFRPEVRRALCAALGAVGGAGARAALETIARQADDPVQADARRAIAEIDVRRRGD